MSIRFDLPILEDIYDLDTFELIDLVEKINIFL
jgi:hypothetical protein